MRFLCNHSHKKEKHYHLCKSCFTSIPCIKRDECRPEDNGDNDTIVFNKHSVVKKSQLAKETWWIGLQDRTTDLNLGKPRKNLVSGNVKCSRLEPQDKDFSAYAPQLFSNYIFFLFMIFQILTSVKEITLVTWMLHARTPLDHMYVNVTLDILEMEKTAQVNLIPSLQYSRIVLHDTFDYSAAPSSCVARQLDNLSLRNSVILSSRVHLLECSSRYLMRI